MKSITSTDAKARLNAVLAEVEKSGVSVTITSHGRPVAVLSPVSVPPREFGFLPGLDVPDDFDAPLPEAELAEWDGVE